MPDFSPTDAAFEGFRFTRERPGAVAAWAGVSLVFNVLSVLAALLIGGQALRNFEALAGRAGSLMEILELLLPAAPALLAIFAITMSGMAFVYSSALRTFVGRDLALTFRIGEDERRVALIIATFFLIYLGVTIIVLLGLGVAASISDAFTSWLGGFFVWVTPVATFVAVSFVMIRLSLTPIIAVDRKRISLKESWVSTRGHFWPLAGSLVLSVGLFFAATLVALMIVTFINHMVSLSTGGVVPRDLLSRPETQSSDILPLVISEIISTISYGVLLPVVLGPLVRAYQAYDAPDAPAETVPA
jgi:hypothetical protein